MEIYHQLGHMYQWNFQSLLDDHSGTGVILAPRYMDKEFVEGLDSSIKEKAIFDPQFFRPGFARSKLSSYKFFPDIATGGFETEDYGENYAGVCAEACLNFQIDNDFRYLVIPTRYFSGTPLDYIVDQQRLFIDPFLQVAESMGDQREIIIQLIINNAMIMEKDYSADLLNWITGLPNINGVYIIQEIYPREKQVKDPEFLYSFLHFVDVLSSNKLDVILGYLNNEAILYSLASPKIVTIGSYENLRMFNVRNYDPPPPPDKQPRGPVPRIYTTTLLQWLNHRYIGAIKRAIGPEIFDYNRYQAIMFESTFRWHFTKPEIYKHYFLELSKQLLSIADIQPEERFRSVHNMMKEAASVFEHLEKKGVILDPDSDGSHIPAWLTAANQFAADKGWR